MTDTGIKKPRKYVKKQKQLSDFFPLFSPADKKIILEKPRVKDWWVGVNDVSEQDIIDFVILYNSFITLHGGDFKYLIRYKSKNFLKHKHYRDAIRLYRMLSKLKLKPREYLTVQFEYYKKEKAHPYRRPYPSLKNLCSPVALDRWQQWLIDTKKEKMPATELTKEDMEAYEESYLKDMMSTWGFTEEKLFFKDIVLTRHFTLDFLEKRATFMELVNDHYYETCYSVDNYKELFV